jgi:hypothetical protein
MSRYLRSPTDGADGVHVVDLACGEESAGWMFYELQDIRHDAQAEAQLAYDAWCRLPGRDGYVVYRAAQDRADAAQDQLAGWMRRRQAGRSSECPWR